MSNVQLKEILSTQAKENDHFIRFNISPEETLTIYPLSINRLENHFFFIARLGTEKNLYITFFEGGDSLSRKFCGESVKSDLLADGSFLIRCPMNHENACAVQELFDFTRPVLIGTENSFGLGDRLGLANPGQLRAIAGKNIKPILAQQSIRELERTGRKPEDVMDAAVWAVFQEGYKDGFGADADHLKTIEDIDMMARAGFTMFTFDPGAFVVNDAISLTFSELQEKAKSLPWEELKDTFENFMNRYEDTSFTITGDFNLQPSKEEILRGIVKYGHVLTHTVTLYRNLKDNYPEHPHEIELSVDETDSPTTPFEHFLIVNELKRLGIQLVSLAPRFIGDFEKGIDYKGDIDKFRPEYIKHLKISGLFGPYKISLHSGSDKFSIYEVIGKFREGHFHIKTAGTSYLVALQTIASKDSVLFRDILNFSRDHYETEKKSYHVSANIHNVPPAEKLSDDQLSDIFNQNDAREVLHVTFGKVLTAKNKNGGYLLRERIVHCLNEHEDTHYELLKRHFQRHIKPFTE
ncbi:tagaturonate epimerase family protein [Candidatus Latescibacterota bacterium]